MTRRRFAVMRALCVIAFVPMASACAQPPARTMVTFPELLTASRAAPEAERIVYGAETLQFGELRLPSGKARVPLVVFLHGGCWLSDYTLEHTRAFTAALAQAGYAVWSPEYRRVGDVNGGWPGTFDDIALAMDFIPQLVARHARIDPTRVILMGHSAGGHLALWGAARKANASFHLRGVVSLAGITNLAQYGAVRGGCNAAVYRLMGGSADEQPERYAEVDPMRMPTLTLPLRFVHGELDPIVPLDQSWLYSAKHRAAGGTNVMDVVPGAGHFDLVSPNGEAWEAVRRAVRALLPP